MIYYSYFLQDIIRLWAISKKFKHAVNLTYGSHYENLALLLKKYYMVWNNSTSWNMQINKQSHCSNTNELQRLFSTSLLQQETQILNEFCQNTDTKRKPGTDVTVKKLNECTNLKKMCSISSYAIMNIFNPNETNIASQNKRIILNPLRLNGAWICKWCLKNGAHFASSSTLKNYFYIVKVNKLLIRDFTIYTFRVLWNIIFCFSITRILWNSLILIIVLYLSVIICGVIEAAHSLKCLIKHQTQCRLISIWWCCLLFYIINDSSVHV